MNIGKKLWQAFLIVQTALLGLVIIKTFFAWSELLAIVHLDGFPYHAGPDKVMPSAAFMAALVFSIYVTSRFVGGDRQQG